LDGRPRPGYRASIASPRFDSTPLLHHTDQPPLHDAPACPMNLRPFFATPNKHPTTVVLPRFAQPPRAREESEARRKRNAGPPRCCTALYCTDDGQNTAFLNFFFGFPEYPKIIERSVCLVCTEDVCACGGCHPPESPGRGEGGRIAPSSRIPPTGNSYLCLPSFPCPRNFDFWTSRTAMVLTGSSGYRGLRLPALALDGANDAPSPSRRT
jgi:hypothetical protein